MLADGVKYFFEEHCMKAAVISTFLILGFIFDHIFDP